MMEMNQKMIVMRKVTFRGEKKLKNQQNRKEKIQEKNQKIWMVQKTK